jgi:hypothetical protein
MRVRRLLWLLTGLQLAVAMVLLVVAWKTLPDLFGRLQAWLEGFGGVVYQHDEIAQRMDLCLALSWLAVGLHVGCQSLAALGLPWRQQWARRVTLFFLFANLIFFPLGTAVGVYGLWLLLRRDVRLTFARPRDSELPLATLVPDGDAAIRTTS